MWSITMGKQIVDIASPLSIRAKSKRCFSSKMFKEKYAKVQPLKTPTMIAMDNFDFYYGPVYGNDWPSIRLGLLTPNKYFAVLNKFSRQVSEKTGQFSILKELRILMLVSNLILFIYFAF